MWIWERMPRMSSATLLSATHCTPSFSVMTLAILGSLTASWSLISLSTTLLLRNFLSDLASLPSTAAAAWAQTERKKKKKEGGGEIEEEEKGERKKENGRRRKEEGERMGGGRRRRRTRARTRKMSMRTILSNFSPVYFWVWWRARPPQAHTPTHMLTYTSTHPHTRTRTPASASVVSLNL